MKFRVIWVFAVVVFMVGISLSITAPALSAGDPTPDTVEDTAGADEAEAPKYFRIYLPVTSLEEAQTPLPSPTPESNDYLTRMVARVNEYRVKNGCPAVQMHPILTDVAMAHSEDMAINDYFSHTGSDGSSSGDRVTEAGYLWSRFGEVIAAGYTTPEATVDGWMDSDTHRPILLNCAYVHTGPGYYYLANDTGSFNYHHYWTLILTTPY